jgi:hypothetical protein
MLFVNHLGLAPCRGRWRFAQMKRVVVFVTLLIAAGIVSPRDAPQDPQVGIQLVTAADGSMKVSVTNRSELSVTALTISAERTDANGKPRPYSRIYFDSVTNANAYPEIRSQETRELKLGQAGPSANGENYTAKIEAAVFEDGSTFGDDAAVDVILHAREFAWRNLMAVLKTVDTAKAKTVSKDELLHQLDENQKTESDEARKGHSFSSVRPASMAFNSFKINLNMGGSDPVPAKRIDQISVHLLDLRFRLASSKPQIPGAETTVDADEAAPKNFEIRLPPGTKSETVSVSYALRGAPGSGVAGYSTSLVSHPDVQVYKVPTILAGAPAYGVQVRVVEKGCQVRIINIPELESSSGQADFECAKLPMMEFTGRIEPSDQLSVADYRVRIMMSGVGPSIFFEVGFANVENNGRFHAQITDYSGDPACGPNARSDGGVLRFTVLPAKPGGKGFRLDAENSAADGNGYLRPMPDYGGEVLFRVHLN